MVRNFRPKLEGRTIVGFESRWKKHVSPGFHAVRRKLVGQQIERLTRRGKYIVMNFAGAGFLLTHLRMSGRLEWGPEHEREPAHVRAIWQLDGGENLLFCDARKFGRIVYTDNFAAATAGLGPEPLDRGFTVPRLAEILRRRSRQLKPLLLDQSVIAGLGNIYTDESLHRAGLHPLTRSHVLSDVQIEALHEAIRFVLRKAIRYHGTSIDWIYPGGWMQEHLTVYGRDGETCRACGTTVVRLTVGQRGTHICPSCQPWNRATGTAEH